MSAFRYLVMRASGVAIVVGLSMAVGLIIGLILWLSDGAHGAAAGKDLVAVPLWLGAVAVITHTPIGRAISRGLDNVVVLVIVTVLVTLPFWLVVFPVRSVAQWLGWVVRVDGDR